MRLNEAMLFLLFQTFFFKQVSFSWSSYCHFTPLHFCAFPWSFCCLKWSPDIIWKCYLVLLMQESFNVSSERRSLGRRKKGTKGSDKSLESELLSVFLGAMLTHTSKGHLPLIIQRGRKKIHVPDMNLIAVTQIKTITESKYLSL